MRISFSIILVLFLSLGFDVVSAQNLRLLQKKGGGGGDGGGGGKECTAENGSCRKDSNCCSGLSCVSGSCSAPSNSPSSAPCDPLVDGVLASVAGCGYVCPSGCSNCDKMVCCQGDCGNCACVEGYTFSYCPAYGRQCT